jgi:DNA-directed RNA polymerase specialized sigma24 family protein
VARVVFDGGGDPEKEKPPMSTTTTGSTAEPRSRSRLVTSLNDEWDQLRTSAEASGELASWRRTEPALSSVDALDALPTVVRKGPNQVLEALIRQAQGGSTLAGRCVVQLMLPKIVRIARSQIRSQVTFEDAVAGVLAAMWAEIKRFPLDGSRRSIASCLALNSLREVSRAVERDTAEAVREDSALELEAREVAHLGDAGAQNAGVEVLTVLRLATARRVITTEEARLLAEVYLKADYRTNEAVARELNMSYSMLRQRCSRLTRKLRDHADLLAA